MRGIGLFIAFLAYVAPSNAQDSPPAKHRFGITPRLMVVGGTTEAHEYAWDDRHSISPGFALSYRFEFGDTVAIGADVERWFLRSASGRWYAFSERYSAMVEWAWWRLDSWSFVLNSGLGVTLLWTHESVYHLAGLGPGLSVGIGVKKWFGDIALLLIVGGEADLNLGLKRMTNGQEIKALSALLSLSIGVAFRL